MSEYRNFRRYALERAKKDINELSDISMDYEPIKAKKGGKVIGVRFMTCYKSQIVEDTDVSASTDETEPDSVDIFEFIDSMRVFMTDDCFTVKDLKSIVEAANLNMEKIRKAYEIFCKPHSADIESPSGYMIKLIKSNAQAPKPKKATRNTDATFKTDKSGQGYMDFEQRTDDLDELVQRRVLKRMSKSSDDI